MSIRSKKAAADRLVREVEAQRQSRKQHSRKALSILRDRIASPKGLAVCFGLGAAAGYRTNGHPGRRTEGGAKEDGFLKRAVDGPVGGIALRLAAATIVRALMQPPSPEEPDAPHPAAESDAALTPAP